MKANKFSVIIPARMHSTRLPHKMTLDLGGVPLIVRTAKQASLSQATQVIVATDHPDIVSICNEHNITSVLTKDTHQSGTDRLNEATQILNLSTDEVIINVQGDEPLIDPNLINELADFIITKKPHVATIAHKIIEEDEIFNPNIVKIALDHENNALYFSRAPIPFYRDGYPPTHAFKLTPELNVLRHIGIYAYTVGFLQQYEKLPVAAIEKVEALEQLRVLYNGFKIGVLETEKVPPRGVDTLEDLMYIRQLLGHDCN